jgi:hypothetical protein
LTLSTIIFFISRGGEIDEKLTDALPGTRTAIRALSGTFEAASKEQDIKVE